MTDLPIACTLATDARQARREDLLGGLFHRALERTEIPNGYRLRFAAADGIVTAIAGVIENERQCCRFLSFRLTADADHGPVWLEFTGPPGTNEFLEGIVDS